MNADGSNQKRLTVNSANDSYPKWWPDGRIVFSSTREGTEGVYVMNDDGANVTRLTQSGGEPSCSSDGRKIAFVAYADGIQQLFTADSNGSNVRRLTTKRLLRQAHRGRRRVRQ